MLHAACPYTRTLIYVGGKRKRKTPEWWLAGLCCVFCPPGGGGIWPQSFSTCVTKFQLAAKYGPDENRNRLEELRALLWSLCSLSRLKKKKLDFTQGWEFAHSLIAHFAQIIWTTVSDSLRSLMTNERPWVNRSGCSRQMSNSEWIAQVAHDKWANEWFAQKKFVKKI